MVAKLSRELADQEKPIAAFRLFVRCKFGISGVSKRKAACRHRFPVVPDCKGEPSIDRFYENFDLAVFFVPISVLDDIVQYFGKCDLESIEIVRGSFCRFDPCQDARNRAARTLSRGGNNDFYRPLRKRARLRSCRFAVWLQEARATCSNAESRLSWIRITWSIRVRRNTA